MGIYWWKIRWETEEVMKGEQESKEGSSERITLTTKDIADEEMAIGSVAIQQQGVKEMK